MRKKNDRQTPNKRSFHKKIIIASSVLSILMLGSITTMAADRSITSILQDWFYEQETEAIEEIDDSIEEERIEQTERLKTTLQDMLEGQKADLDEVVAEEKDERTEALKTYADELIEDMKAEHPEASEEIDLPTEDLDVIMEEAKQQIEAIVKQGMSEGTSEETEEDGKSQDDEEDGGSEGI